MTSRTKILAPFFLLAIVVLLLYIRGRATHEVTVSDIEKELRTSIPTGTSRAVVEAYLDSKGIERKYSEKSNSGPQFDRTEWARIRGSSRSLVFVRRDFQILVRFDEAGRLIDSSVKEAIVGLQYLHSVNF